MGSSAIELQMNDYRLTTADILYHLPDHPDLLQQYIWQEYDLAPRFPELKKFLAFWEENLEGRLHSVRVASLPIITSPNARHCDVCYTLQ